MPKGTEPRNPRLCHMTESLVAKKLHRRTLRRRGKPLFVRFPGFVELRFLNRRLAG